jgi:MoxR-like ATPase
MKTHTLPLSGPAAQFVTDWNAYKYEVQKVIVGLEDVIQLAGIAFFSNGHFLMEALPGAGKTTLAEALSAAIKDGVGGFFPGTADLMPMDIIGSKAWNPETKRLEIQPGAITDKMNIVVVDETNRLAPKTASALLEVMQGRRINIQGHSMPCADPFLVIGTQNPIEQEGTYPMPEALLDRFAMRLSLKRLSRELEIELTCRPAVYAVRQAEAAGVVQVLTPTRMREMRNYAQSLPIEPAVSAYIVDLVRATDPNCAEFTHMPKEFKELVQAGSGLRGSIWLTSTARAHAAMRGSDQVHVSDVQAVAPYVLQHRITLTPDARFNGSKGLEQKIVEALIECVPTVR